MTMIEAARRGDIDISFNLPVNEVARYGLAGYFNNEKAPLTDVALRKAMRHAIDTVPIAQINYERNHLAFVAGDIIPPLMGKAIGVIEPRRWTRRWPRIAPILRPRIAR